MRGREESLIPLVVGTGEDGPSVEEDLDDLVFVRVGRQDERGDVRGEGRCVRGDCLPALTMIMMRIITVMIIIIMIRIMTIIIIMIGIRILMTNYPGFAFFVNRLLVVKQYLKKSLTILTV